MRYGVLLLSMTAVLCALGIALRDPASVSAGSKAKARGAELFATRGCAHCHGPNGSGGKRGPDLSGVGRRLKPGAMRTQIRNGGKSMPEFGDLLSNTEIDDLVAYLKAKRARTTPVVVIEPQPPIESPPQP